MKKTTNQIKPGKTAKTTRQAAKEIFLNTKWGKIDKTWKKTNKHIHLSGEGERESSVLMMMVKVKNDERKGYGWLETEEREDEREARHHLCRYDFDLFLLFWARLFGLRLVFFGFLGFELKISLVYVKSCDCDLKVWQHCVECFLKRHVFMFQVFHQYNVTTWRPLGRFCGRLLAARYCKTPFLCGWFPVRYFNIL